MAGKRSNRARAAETASATEKIAAYKTILKEYIDRRPSGMRQKLAAALGKHKSFISQITGPSYAMPIPVAHLQTIFDICHFSPAERKVFLAAYSAAHPARRNPLQRIAAPARIANRILQLEIPLLADASQQKAVEELLKEFANKVFALIQSSQSRNGRS